MQVLVDFVVIPMGSLGEEHEGNYRLMQLVCLMQTEVGNGLYGSPRRSNHQLPESPISEGSTLPTAPSSIRSDDDRRHFL